MPALPSTPPESRAIILRLLADHGRKHIGAYALAALLMAVGAAATALSAYLLKPVLDHMVKANGFEALELLSLSIAGLFLVRGLATYCYLVLLARTGNRIVADVQAKLFDHLLMQDMAFFQDRHSGEFMAKIAIAAASIRDTLQLLIVSAGRDLLTLSGLIVVMFDPGSGDVGHRVGLDAARRLFLRKVIKRVRMLARTLFPAVHPHIIETMQEAIQGMRIGQGFTSKIEMRPEWLAASVPWSSNQRTACRERRRSRQPDHRFLRRPRHRARGLSMAAGGSPSRMPMPGSFFPSLPRC